MSKFLAVVQVIKEIITAIKALMKHLKRKKLKDANAKSVGEKDQRPLEEALSGESSGPTRYEYDGLQTRPRQDQGED